MEIQAAFFNAEVRLFLSMRIRFSFEKGGYMRKEILIESISANL